MTEQVRFMRFQNKCAVVTGAASDIGRATALLFAREGATVFAADIDVQGAEALATEARTILSVRCDVCDPDQFKALMEQAATACGGIDYLFNNAGAGGALEAVDEIDADGWDSTMALLLRSVAMGIRHAVSHLKRQWPTPIGGPIVVPTRFIQQLSWPQRPRLAGYTCRTRKTGAH
jgi:NAD(P)-dependent dehydrogenase (short-subunit alcohol dehydrogenase family)